MHFFRFRLLSAAVSLVALATAPAGAAPASAAPNQNQAQDDAGNAATPPARTADDAHRALAPFRQAAPATLDQMRGGSDAVTNNIASDTQLRGATEGNSATNVVTGNNMIQSSFSNATGIPVVIQNSGANVLIQNATVVNLQFN